jgi:hypothetical protein
MNQLPADGQRSATDVPREKRRQGHPRTAPINAAVAANQRIDADAGGGAQPPKERGGGSVCARAWVTTQEPWRVAAFLRHQYRNG